MSTGKAGVSEAGAASLRISELTASPVEAWEPWLITRVLAMASTRMKAIRYQVAFSRMVAVWRTPRAWFAEVKLVAAVLAVLQEDDHDQQDGREDNQDDQDGECDVHIFKYF